MDKNVLIEASAGTGKTQALAERLIALAKGRVEPHEIVALTFSRMAAGEIFERFVSLLAESAANGDGESVALLRKVVATQHLSLIGTLDSFLMRIVRSFPLELGLAGNVAIMDDYAAGCERARTSFRILRRTDAKTRRAFADAFSLAMNGEDVRSFIASYREFIKEWHSLLLDNPEARSWGDASAIWGDGASWTATTEADLSRLADALVGMCPGAKWPEFVEWVRNFRGGLSDVKGMAKKILELGAEGLFSHATVEFSFNRKEYSFGGEQARAIREAILGVCGYVIRQKLELVRGVHGLMSAYETEYAAKVRGAGKIVFDDVPRLLACLPGDVRLALEYRLDSRIRAWALDEFQDTSRGQWGAIGPLIDEAKADSDRSVFIVGDRKQAIYGWRNGDVGIFRREKEGGAYVLKPRDKTFRSSPAIVDAVNQVFVDGRLRTEYPSWEASKHESAHPDWPGFVQVVDSPGKKLTDFFEPVRNALRAVDPVGRGLSAAILVRGNSMGESLAAYLKQNEMKGVVWEGESAILDTPALQGFLDLVKLADHPGYQQAYRHFASTPLAAAMWPEGVPDAAAVSQAASQAFTAKGLVRAFREMRAKLPAKPEEAWSAFTEGRFTDMLRAAAEFELATEPGTRLSDFVDFLASKKKRNIAEPGKIKIMTIHRSKGLGFDYVVLPLYEHNPITADEKKPIVGDGWVMPDPGAVVSSILPGIAPARAERQIRVEEEALCTYYVAMTRAKYAMTVICHPASKERGESLRMSDFVRESIPNAIGDPKWHEKVEAERKASGGDNGTKPADKPAPVPFHRAKRTAVRRRLPSLSLRSGMSAGELFADAAARRAALRRGTDVHAMFESVEWVDPAAPGDDTERRILENGWTDAFVRGPDVTALWRERGYELLVGSEWTSGQFDRVVFAGEGEGRRATIYDFKTNAVGKGETREEFARRMGAAYAGQMAAYRSAVASLAGLPPERVRSVLLLTSTGDAVPVEA